MQISTFSKICREVLFCSYKSVKLLVAWIVGRSNKEGHKIDLLKPDPLARKFRMVFPGAPNKLIFLYKLETFVLNFLASGNLK